MRRSVDWDRFCRLWNLDFTKTSDSTARGYINVHCPLCGPADEGHHMGLHKFGWWTCFRDPVSHRGKDPRRIISLLVGCSYAEASNYVNDDIPVDTSDFDQAVFTFLAEDKIEPESRNKLIFPEEFRFLKSRKGRARIYWDYLVSRGFLSDNVRKIARRYSLRFCDRGKWRGRIILPVYIGESLVSWTGRSVYDTEKLRYLSLSHKPDSNPRAKFSIRDLLFNYDRATQRNHRVCVLVEGPFDAIKVDYYGRKHGICSVATFGTSINIPQLDLLEHVRTRCKRLVICGDVGADANVMDLQSATAEMKLESVDLPPDVGDPGDLTKQQVLDIFTSVKDKPLK